MNFNGNQYTGGKIKYGEALSNSFKKASGWINVIGMGISLVQCSTADNIDDRIKYGADVLVLCQEVHVLVRFGFWEVESLFSIMEP